MRRSGLIATKIGNSSYYHEDGKNTHVTVLKVDECIVARVKTSDKDGYNAVQLASVDTGKDISQINKYCSKLFWSEKLSNLLKLTLLVAKPPRHLYRAAGLFLTLNIQLVI